MSSRQYRHFIPPPEVAGKPHRDWSKSEAEIYFDWLVGVTPDRARYLLRFLGLDERMLDRTTLLELGSRVVRLLPSEAYSRAEGEGNRILSDCGYALAADMGLVTGQLLLEALQPRVRWEILRKPKSDLSYNLPVLTGFGGFSLDPIGGSIAEANGVLLGRRGSDAWVRILDYWSERAKGSP